MNRYALYLLGLCAASAALTISIIMYAASLI